MDIAERVGEATLRFAGRVYYHALGVVIRLILLTRELRSRAGEFERRRLYPLLERRGVEFRDYVVLKAQLTTFGFFLVAVLLIFDFLSPRAGAVLLLLLGAACLLVTFGQVREHFGGDFPAYRDFFLAYFLITLLLLLLSRLVPSPGWGYPNVHLFLFAILAVGVFSAYFKRQHARDFTYGRVLKGGSVALVKTSYDIRAGVKPGMHLVPNDAGAGEGEVVKLRVEKSFFNLRGNPVVEILEVAGDEGQGGGGPIPRGGNSGAGAPIPGSQRRGAGEGENRAAGGDSAGSAGGGKR
ncbi:MAG: DUF2101 domain-containing protein [Euryarchaeota archaeon]|nr:DUF2101 domain-containing protein [Euryarchaeota archaeon]